MNKFYTLPLGPNIAERLETLRGGFFPGERILSTVSVDGELLITTEMVDSQGPQVERRVLTAVRGRSNNLLLEDVQYREEE